MEDRGMYKKDKQKKDLRSMHEVLIRKQYMMYLRILDATVTNCGLNE